MIWAGGQNNVYGLRHAIVSRDEEALRIFVLPDGPDFNVLPDGRFNLFSIVSNESDHIIF